MAYAVATWNNTPDTWEREADLTSTIVRHFIKSGGVIKSFNIEEGIWVDTELVEPISIEDFENLGIEDLSVIPSEKWNEIDDIFEVIVWDEDDTIEGNKWVQMDVAAFTPMDLLNEEDEFEVLTWTNDFCGARGSKDWWADTVDEGVAFRIDLESFDLVNGISVQ